MPPTAAEPERERIREALIVLVARHGLAEITVEMIAERAGISRGEFERHYADKQDCFDRVWEELANEFMAGLRASAGSLAPWRERVRAAGYYTIRYFQEDQRRGTFFALGTLGGGEVAQARRERIVALAVELVDEGRQELDDPDSVPRARAEAAVGAIYEAIMAANRKGIGEVEGDWFPQLMYMMVFPYLGAEAAQEELRRGPEDFARFKRGEL